MLGSPLLLLFYECFCFTIFLKKTNIRYSTFKVSTGYLKSPLDRSRFPSEVYPLLDNHVTSFNFSFITYKNRINHICFMRLLSQNVFVKMSQTLGKQWHLGLKICIYFRNYKGFSFLSKIFRRGGKLSSSNTHTSQGSWLQQNRNQFWLNGIY